jgi:hypothetical protein
VTKKIPRDFWDKDTAKNMYPMHTPDGGLRILATEHELHFAFMFPHCEEDYVMIDRSADGCLMCGDCGHTINVRNSLGMAAVTSVEKYRRGELWDIERWFKELGYKRNKKGMWI